ncbi:MAG: F0F1 ATP synthase subunit delta [Micromonosporaceae bacterium]
MEPSGRESSSRESYAAALARLESLVRGERPVPLAGVGDEVLTVAGVLAREPRLRRALSDPSRPGEDRAGLLRSLLEGKVTEDTATLLGVLASGRWSSGADLLDATERLGVEALLASAELGEELGEVEDELFRFGQIVDGDPVLAATLGDSSSPPARRAELVHLLLDGRARPVTLRLAEVALHGFGGRGFAASLTRLVELAAQRRGRQVAYVSAAAPLTDEQESRLGQVLAEKYGRPVALKVTVDPDLLGGLRVQVGHDLYDGTVLRRLLETRAALSGRR